MKTKALSLTAMVIALMGKNANEQEAANIETLAAEKLNRNGMAQLKAELADGTETAKKYKRLATAQRLPKIAKRIEELAEQFPKGGARKSGQPGHTRQDNPSLNARRMKVVVLEKQPVKLLTPEKQGPSRNDGIYKVVAIYASIQETHRLQKTAEGKVISDSSICYCANGNYGFAGAGGFRFAFERDCKLSDDKKTAEVHWPTGKGWNLKPTVTEPTAEAAPEAEPVAEAEPIAESVAEAAEV